MSEEIKIAVIGQGYVGLPLAIAFAEHYPVWGYDIDVERVEELRGGKDHTLEVDASRLSEAIEVAVQTDFAKGYKATHSPEDLKEATVFIVTVPTPIDEFKAPDLNPHKTASEMLGEVIGKGAVVIYESTVYPGCTEEECVPILEQVSGLKYNKDFYVGYSPERVNP